MYTNHTELNFRIHNGITIAYSRKLHYYDEVDCVLTLPEHFAEYVEDHIDQLGSLLHSLHDHFQHTYIAA